MSLDVAIRLDWLPGLWLVCARGYEDAAVAKFSVVNGRSGGAQSGIRYLLSVKRNDACGDSESDYLFRMAFALPKGSDNWRMTRTGRIVALTEEEAVPSAEHQQELLLEA